MTAAAARIMAQVEALSPEDRAELADRVAALADGDVDPGWHDAWTEEILRRNAAGEEERATWPLADTVFAEARQRLRNP